MVHPIEMLAVLYSLFFLTWPLDSAPAQCYYHQFRDNPGAKLSKTDCRFGAKLPTCKSFKSQGKLDQLVKLEKIKTANIYIIRERLRPHSTVGSPMGVLLNANLCVSRCQCLGCLCTVRYNSFAFGWGVVSPLHSLAQTPPQLSRSSEKRQSCTFPLLCTICVG